MDGAGMGWSTPQYLALAGLLIVFCVLGIARGARIDPPLSIISTDVNDSIDAVLAADADLASVVDAELVEDELKHGNGKSESV